MQDGIVDVDDEDALVDAKSTNGTLTSFLVISLVLVFLYFMLLLVNRLAAVAANYAARGTNHRHDEAMQEARRRLQERFNRMNQPQVSVVHEPNSSSLTDVESKEVPERPKLKPKVKADLLKKSGYNPLMGDDTDKVCYRSSRGRSGGG
uniref:Selenoprotein S (SelS) n=1 Tax=Schistocephalus solidus TaxID=70667 RepID=A0A0X3NS62_SCHSO